MKPDYDLLQKHIKSTHFQKENGEPYSCCDACCVNIGTNCLCCTTKDARNDNKFGLGVNLYFKFLKSTIWYLVSVFLINAILMFIYYQSKLSLISYLPSLL